MSDDCIICGKWPEADRWALREMLDTLPLNDEPFATDASPCCWRTHMMAMARTAFGAIAMFAVALECPRATAVFGAVPYWLVAHSG